MDLFILLLLASSESDNGVGDDEDDEVLSFSSLNSPISVTSVLQLFAAFRMSLPLQPRRCARVAVVAGSATDPPKRAARFGVGVGGVVGVAQHIRIHRSSSSLLSNALCPPTPSTRHPSSPPPPPTNTARGARARLRLPIARRIAFRTRVPLQLRTTSCSLRFAICYPLIRIWTCSLYYIYIYIYI